MKKIVTVTVVVMSLMMLIGGNQAKAQEAPYKMGIGLNVLSMEAVSFKTFVKPKLAFELEFGFKWTRPGGIGTRSAYGGYYGGWWYLYTLEANPNLFYQSMIKEWNFGRLDWFAGGGVSLGYAWSWGSSGKFGVNAGGGVELAFKKIPLAVQTDFRPGYGMLFTGSSTAHFFDWGLNMSVRYCFGK